MSLSIINYLLIRNNEINLQGSNVFKSEGNSDEFIQLAYKHFGIAYPKFYKMDTLSKIGLVASELLLNGHNKETLDPFQKGMIFQNTQSSLMTDKKYAHTIADIPSPALFVYTLPNIVMGEIAIRNGFKGENTFFVTEQFDAQQLVVYSDLLFKKGVVSQLLCGRIEYTTQNQDVFLMLIENEDNPLLEFNIQNLNQIYSA